MRAFSHLVLYTNCYIVIKCSFVLFVFFKFVLPRKKKQDEEEAEQKRKATEMAYQGSLGSLSLYEGWCMYFLGKGEELVANLLLCGGCCHCHCLYVMVRSVRV